jgi:hypothetical protein
MAICIDPIELCARVIGRIDLAADSIVAYARDEELAEVPEFGL